MDPPDTGGRKPRVTDRDLLDVFRDAEDPVLSTAEVADAVPIKRRGTLNRLRGLEDAGDLESKQIGGRNTVWWLADLLDVESDRSETRADTSATDTGAESADTRPESDTLPEDVRDYLEREDVPPKTEHGRSAVVDVFRFLREHGTAKTGEIQDAVYPDYTEEWGSARTMWNALDRYLPDVPGVEKGGYGEWEYTGDDDVREELEP
ncbi:MULTISPECIES: hypothetical protein [Halolamina]|uniref:Uncharacterized protein n=2 Tax=Halolamina TaxID=1075397 RepID=A0A1I5WCE4_9EURY|nr:MULTISPECIES: hypothetical protein [Halolamina]SFQ17307.1 hypothetical protein SAMN05216277_1273 [Halolamina pelagica]